MKKHYPKLLRIIIALSIMLSSLTMATQAHASSPSDYGQNYGLLVHAKNFDQGMTKQKALQVLEAYFPDTGLDINAGAAGFMSQREFLLWFEKLRMASEGETTILPDTLLYVKTWLRVRRHNLLPQTRLTYSAVREFLYRYAVSHEYGGRPYLDGLVLNEDEINAERFSSLSGVREIKSDLFAETLKMKTLGVLKKNDRAYLNVVSSRYEAFDELEDKLIELKHPFKKIPDMSAEMRQVITDNGLTEVLSSLTYDYSTNEDYRKHNLVTGAMQIHGKLYDPGAEIDFTQVLAEDGWGKYRYGWVIFGGKDEWQFGGGLCGVTTLAFTPSWKAGLDVVERFPHSIYYKSLYPEESFGIDAAIYRGSKNLVMRNSTNDPLLFYVKNDEEKEAITLYVIGNAPYYSIEIEGPIQVNSYTYKYIRRMQQIDGTVIEDELISKYGAIR